MSKIVLDGAIDLHCHFGPESVIGVRHSVDAFEAARDAAALGFAAIVLKSHDFPSNSVAYAVAQTVDEVRVCGSICCDFCIGGLNPGRGIELLDDNGRLRPEVEEILALIAQYDAIAATGHTSTAEHFAVARNFASKGRLVVTHAMNAGAGPQLTVQECVELAQLGAYIELAAATCMAGHGPSVDDVVKAIGVIGPEMIVLSTDYGWNHELPRPAAGLHAYVDALWDAGASEAQLRRMVCDNPARLLRMLG